MTLQIFFHAIKPKVKVKGVSTHRMRVPTPPVNHVFEALITDKQGLRFSCLECAAHPSGEEIGCSAV